MGSENKRERFVRVAENRTNRALASIKAIGACANKNNYEYTEEDIKKIFLALERQIKATKDKLMGVKEKDDRFYL